MSSEDKLINYLLHLADNSLIIGHRLSEWTGHGPVLEQDIAITNISLDYIGQARSLYQYAADLMNKKPVFQRQKLFSSPALQQKQTNYTEDDFPYLRDAWDFKNLLLLEQPNGNWADTIARSFYFNHYLFALYDFLQKNSKDEQLSAIAEKSLKEVIYHCRWTDEWVIRLGDGTEESKEKMQTAINNLWSYTGEMFEASDDEKETLLTYGFNMEEAKNNWLNKIKEVLDEATLTMPDKDAWMRQGGKKGVHSEHLGYILAEMQFLQRAYPGLEW